MNKTLNRHKTSAVFTKDITNREHVIATLEKLGYRVGIGVSKDISDPNYSGIIGKPARRVVG